MKDFVIPRDDRDMGTPVRAGQPVSLTVDGIAVSVPEGTSILQRAAAEAGIAIPKLCATDSVEAFGSCRLCVVEIEGRRGTPASCTTPVTEGMVVHTQSDRVRRIRKLVMELYISDHPLDCLTCAANGDCELQDMPVRWACATSAMPRRRTAPSATISRRGTPAAAPTRNGWRRTSRTPTFTQTRRSASSARAASAPARRFRHLRPDHLGARLRQPGLGRGRGRRLPAVRLRRLRRLRPGLPPPPPCRRNRSSTLAPRTGRWSPPAPTVALAACSRPSCPATGWCAWCRGAIGRRTTAIPA